VKIAVDNKALADLKNWFTSYVQTFKDNDTELQQNIDLKEHHTERVCQEILSIGKKLGLNAAELRLAEIIALLHDIGRFEQFARYRTFMDRHPVDHAELSTKILGKSGVLKQFNDATRKVILRAIKNHNRPSLPRKETGTCLFFSKLLRDADKLDNWKVITDYYHRKDESRNGAIELGLPDTPGFSEEVYQDLMNKRIVDMKHVRNLNDLKLFQTGWIFDIRFKPTFDSVKKRRYLEMMRKVLPESKEINEIFDVIHIYLVDCTG
jgi:HD superfamily phosphohydrolase YqeK